MNEATIPRHRLSLIRESESPHMPGDWVGEPEAVAAWLWREIYHDAPQEKMSAVYLDVRNRVISYQVAFVGTARGLTADPRVILSAALLCNAHSYILAHNHPSGDPSPSAEDLAMTRRMSDAGELLGIRLVDHLILGDESRWVSLRRRGW